MLVVLPIGLAHFPSTGIQDNLADQAKSFGVPVWKFGEGAHEAPPIAPRAVSDLFESEGFSDAGLI